MALDGFELLPNGSFSKKNPLLQTHLDSSSMNDFKVCPRRYYYSIVYGFQPAQESVHLTFGVMLHRAVELYWTYRLNHQMKHKDALFEVTHDIMVATWDKELNRPWERDEKVPNKNRYTLMRTIIWYLEKYQNDPIETVRIGDKLAIELPFRFGSSYQSVTTGEEFVLCGRLDRIGELNGIKFVTDIKSTGNTLGEYYFGKFTPDNQFTMYTLAAKTVFHVDVSGVMVDACQVVQSFSTFDRKIIHRSDEHLKNWHKDLEYFLEQLEKCAYNDNWPMNDSVCGLYGGCPFRKVCSEPSATGRRAVLRGEYKRRVWDPTFERMDY